MDEDDEDCCGCGCDIAVELWVLVTCFDDLTGICLANSDCDGFDGCDRVVVDGDTEMLFGFSAEGCFDDLSTGLLGGMNGCRGNGVCTRTFGCCFVV